MSCKFINKVFESPVTFFEALRFTSKNWFMKKIISILATAFFLTSAIAQKTIHDANVEVRNVSSFHAIEVSGGIDLYISNGDEAVAVSAKDMEVRDRIKTEVENGILKIYYDWKKGMKLSLGNKSLRAYVSFKNLDKLSASGGSDIIAEGTLKSSVLKLDLSGGSDFKGKVDVNNLNVDQSGGSDVHINGSANTIMISASGGSDFRGYDLTSDVCSISASGGSDIDITVNKELTAEASGASDVSWKGNATVKKAKASGAGSVSHKS